MTPLEINRLCQWLIDYRDRIGDRGDRDRLADVCNALDGYAKLTRSVERAAPEDETAGALYETMREIASLPEQGGCGDGIDAVDLWMLMQRKARAAVEAYENAVIAKEDRT